MLQALPKKYGKYIFNSNPKTIRQCFDTVRKNLAENQKNPRFIQIHVHTFRHYFASNLYRKTKILKTVQDALGHKSIMNTEIYTRTVVFRDEEYYSAMAKTVQEVCKLAEDGWSFFAEIEGIKVFRKPK
jgi:integrase